jgi:hypothetical protein
MIYFLLLLVCLAVLARALSYSTAGRRLQGVGKLYAHSPRESKRSSRRKLAQSKRPVRKTGASFTDRVENPDTLPEGMTRVIAPSEALTDSATTVVGGNEAPEGSLKKNKIPKVELIKIRSNYLFDPLQEEMTDDRYVGSCSPSSYFPLRVAPHLSSIMLTNSLSFHTRAHPHSLSLLFLNRYNSSHLA